jgi:hypothetical protein
MQNPIIKFTCIKKRLSPVYLEVYFMQRNGHARTKIESSTQFNAFLELNIQLYNSLRNFDYITC